MRALIAPSDRNGRHAYDDLLPELRTHADSAPGDPGHGERRERLVREFLPLVHNMARRFSTPNSAEDIEQVGTLALIKAIDRYDPDASDRGPLAYLVPTIRGEMLRYLRDTSWAVHVPRDTKELAVRVQRTADTLASRLGRAPRPSELADELDVPVAAVLDSLQVLQNQYVASLDQPRPDERLLADLLGDDDAAIELVTRRHGLQARIGALPARERTILLLRFYGEKTQHEIGEQLGISQMHVSRLLSRTLRRLRDDLEDDAGQPAVAPGGRPDA